MITRIRGRLESISDDQLVLRVDPFDYVVLIPDFTRRQLQSQRGETVELFTVHYLEGNPSQGGRLTPRLVGFLDEIEREFFELFCSVDGVGVKKALRAMVRPVQEVAMLIESENAKGLATLPGIGPATADRVIAKLRRKMPKFALLVRRDSAAEADVQPDVVDDTYQLLCKLGHPELEARRMLDEALASKRRYPDVESLLNAVYQQRQAD